MTDGDATAAAAAAAAEPTADTTQEPVAPASTTEDQAASNTPADAVVAATPKEEADTATAEEAAPEPEAQKAKSTTQSSSSPPAPAGTSTREKRVRKSVDSFDPSSNLATKTEFVIPNGSGEKLSDMPRVVANLKDITWSDPHLKMLHQIVFGRGQKKEFKSHLLQFNGLVFPSGKEEEEREKLLQKMYKLVLGDLKEVMDLCDIDRSADKGGKSLDKDMLCNRFLEWLEKPKSSGKKVKVKAAPAKKAARKSADSSDSAKKRGRPKGSTTGSAKKAKASATAKAEVVEDKDDEIDFNIPGVELEKINDKIKEIVANADKETLTVRGVRKILEEWLDTDLEQYKDAVRALVMQAM